MHSVYADRLPRISANRRIQGSGWGCSFCSITTPSFLFSCSRKGEIELHGCRMYLVLHSMSTKARLAQYASVRRRSSFFRGHQLSTLKIWHVDQVARSEDHELRYKATTIY